MQALRQQYAADTNATINIRNSYITLGPAIGQAAVNQPVPQADRKRNLWTKHSRPSLQTVLKVIDSLNNKELHNSADILDTSICIIVLTMSIIVDKNI